MGHRRLHGSQPAAAEELAAAGRPLLAARALGRRDAVTHRSTASPRPSTARASTARSSIVAAPETALVTLTVTEAGYALDADGRPDLGEPDRRRRRRLAARNLDAARFDLSDAPRTAARPSARRSRGRRRAGARRASRSSRATTCPRTASSPERRCSRSPSSPAATATREHLAEHVTFVSTSIDRITPKTTTDDVAAVAAATGWRDRSPVVTEPFHDWVLSGEFPGGRPAWETRRRALRRRHRPVRAPQAVAAERVAHAPRLRGRRARASHRRRGVGDPVVRSWVEEFWTEAVAAPARRGPRPRRLPRRTARPIRQRPHPAPARPDRPGRHDEAARAHRARAAWPSVPPAAMARHRCARSGAWVAAAARAAAGRSRRAMRSRQPPRSRANAPSSHCCASSTPRSLDDPAIVAAVAHAAVAFDAALTSGAVARRTEHGCARLPSHFDEWFGNRLPKSPEHASLVSYPVPGASVDRQCRRSEATFRNGAKERPSC